MSEQTDPEQEKKVPCAVMSRVVGYISEVRLWHDGKKHEFATRRNYRIKAIPDAKPR